MSVVTSKRGNTALSGQHLVDAFVEDLVSYLKNVPKRSITATRHKIVEAVVSESPRLQHCSIDNLARQLQMALTAPCRSHLGIYIMRGENHLVTVAI